MCPWKSFIMSNFHGVSARNPCQYSLKLRIGKVSLVYFVDHPLEAKIWSNNSQNLNFNDILTQVATRKYLSAASGREADDNRTKEILKTLQSAYRDLSERVHGKYAFLQSTASLPDTF